MKKTFDKQGNHDGWEVGDILIHTHIHYPEDWMLTIRAFDIFGENLCQKSITNDMKIARYVFRFLKIRRDAFTKQMNVINKYT